MLPDSRMPRRLPTVRIARNARHISTRYGSSCGKRRRDREDAGRDADRNRQRVVHEQRRRGNQTGGRPDVLLRHDVRAAAGRVGVNRLPIGEGDDRQQRRDDEADRHRVDERAHARDDERGQDEVGRVRDRRQRVGRQHGQARDTGQALVVRQMRRDRSADEETLERERGVFRHPRALTARYARCASV